MIWSAFGKGWEVKLFLACVHASSLPLKYLENASLWFRQIILQDRCLEKITITELQITNTFKAVTNWPAACQKLVSLGEGANQLCIRLCWFT